MFLLLIIVVTRSVDVFNPQLFRYIQTNFGFYELPLK